MPSSKVIKSYPVLEQAIHPNACGIDMGAQELVAAVPSDRDPHPVRTFSTTTPDLYRLRDWLIQCGVDTVAMESTGNYWIATYQILEDAGIKVCLVNARHIKGVPGRKTDVCDAQWIQQLHRSGLLHGSFRPDKEIVPLRYLMRHRSGLVESAGREVQLMQKVLTEMNIKLHHVFSDLDGESAQRIITAIIGGERDGEKLWDLRDRRCKSTKVSFLAAIEGDWRLEYLFVLKQCQQRYQRTVADIDACNQQIAEYLKSLHPEKEENDTNESSTPQNPPTIRNDKTVKQSCVRGKNNLGFSVVNEAMHFYNVDLTSVDGIGAGTVAVLMSELGNAEQILKAFPSGKHFASWMGLCPDNRISGGKILGSKTRSNANRVARALRMASQAVTNSKSELGGFCRRMKARLGKVEGTTAVAHKLARIIYAMISTGRPYDEETAFHLTGTGKKKKLKCLQKQAEKLGMQLVPA